MAKEASRWCEENREKLAPRGSLIDHAFNIYYFSYLTLDPRTVEIIEKTERGIVCRWRSFCEVLKAYKLLELDTRIICKKAYKKHANVLLKEIDPRLRFTRNYDRIRLYTDFCEEIIELV